MLITTSKNQDWELENSFKINVILMSKKCVLVVVRVLKSLITGPVPICSCVLRFKLPTNLPEIQYVYGMQVTVTQERSDDVVIHIYEYEIEVCFILLYI